MSARYCPGSDKLHIMWPNANSLLPTLGSLSTIVRFAAPVRYVTIRPPSFNVRMSNYIVIRARSSEVYGRSVHGWNRLSFLLALCSVINFMVYLNKFPELQQVVLCSKHVAAAPKRPECMAPC